MAIVPVRLSPVFLVREQVTVPFPLPEDGLTFVIHAAAEEATALHVQDSPVVTFTVPIEASAETSAEDGEKISAGGRRCLRHCIGLPANEDAAGSSLACISSNEISHSPVSRFGSRPHASNPICIGDGRPCTRLSGCNIHRSV